MSAVLKLSSLLVCECFSAKQDAPWEGRIPAAKENGESCANVMLWQFLTGLRWDFAEN